MQYHSKYDKMYDDAVCAGAVLRLHSECTTWLFEFTALKNSPLQIDGKNQFVHSIFYICFIPYFAIPGESNYQTNIDISIARPKFKSTCAQIQINFWHNFKPTHHPKFVVQLILCKPKFI